MAAFKQLFGVGPALVRPSELQRPEPLPLPCNSLTADAHNVQQLLDTPTWKKKTDDYISPQEDRMNSLVVLGASAYLLVSGEERPTFKKAISNGSLEERIWRITAEYLQELRGQMSGRSVEEVIEVLKSAHVSRKTGFASDKFALLLHAIHLFSTFQSFAAASTPSFPGKSSAEVLSNQSVSGPVATKKKRKHLKRNGKPRAKTGRKPTRHECFVCSAVLPYKFQLIQHFQVCHQVNKSQSLLYKRINQGAENMRRLYSL